MINFMVIADCMYSEREGKCFRQPWQMQNGRLNRISAHGDDGEHLQIVLRLNLKNFTN
jgi:hypothetical protein